MNFPRTTWRLLQMQPAHGAWNMAVDEGILEAAGRGDTPPTLRLYAWQPACLSLGFAQPATDVDLSALQKNGWNLVRRPTGGRAILHTDELTYSVCGPASEARLTGSVLQSYQVLSAALLMALHLLGIPAEAEEKPRPVSAAGYEINGKTNQNPICFEVPSNYEITVEGKKLIGSAQARRKEGVLQHGSLPLFGDLSRITQVLSFPDEKAREFAKERLMMRAITAEAITGNVISWFQAAQAFIQAFSESLNIDFQTAEITSSELARAELLLEEKYANPAWTERV